LAEREYQQDLRRRKQAAEPESVNPGLALVGGLQTRLISPNALLDADESVVAGVRAEISRLDAPRPGLVATVMALARVMDDPKATSTKPAAAGKLADMLEQLRKSGDAKKSKLSSIRSMTSVKTG
jgi:hypothetical protein